MLGKFEYEVLYHMPRDEFARWCAFLKWEERLASQEQIRHKQLARAQAQTQTNK